MKVRQSAAIIALVFLCNAMSFAAIAYSEDLLDGQIQRLRERRKLTMSDAEFLKLREDTFDKFLAFAADLYIEQIKWSLISPEKQSAWPYRSFIVVEPEWVEEIYRKIKEKADKTGDPLLDYALICPALYLVNEPEVQKILTRLERKDQFLYKQAHSNLNTWRTKVSDRLRSRR
jgi:hypothetical protein